MDSLRKQIGLRRLKVKKPDFDSLGALFNSPTEAASCKPILPGAPLSRQMDQFQMQQGSSEKAAYKVADKATKTVLTNGFVSSTDSAAATTCSLPDCGPIVESDADSGFGSDMDPGEDHDKIDADDGDINVWLHPVHGFPQDSSVKAWPVKLAEGESLCHFGPTVLQWPLTTTGISCTCEDGFLKAMDCSKRIAVPLLNATVVDATALPFNCNFTIIRVIESTQANESHELKGWLVLCNTKDRFPLLDIFGRFGCTRQDFSDQYRLQMNHILGAGGAWEVYAAEEVNTSQCVAAKLVKGKSKDEKLAREIKFLVAAGRHENIVRFVGVFDNVSSNLEVPRCCLLFECYQQGDLFTQIATNGPYRGDGALQVILDLLTALAHIHRLGIVHRDVKPENCLLHANGRIVLSDFGSAVHLSEHALLFERVVSLGYAAPEIFMGTMQDTKVDMFSAGATFFMLMTRQHPFPGRTPATIFRRILACAVNWQALDAENVNAQVYDLLENLLLLNQQLRLSADEALQHARLSRMIH